MSTASEIIDAAYAKLGLVELARVKIDWRAVDDYIAAMGDPNAHGGYVWPPSSVTSSRQSPETTTSMALRKCGKCKGDIPASAPECNSVMDCFTFPQRVAELQKGQQP